MAVARRAIRSFGDDECAFLAGAVAYQIFFALLPLLFVIVGLLGFFLTQEEARERAAVLLRDVLPLQGSRRFVDDLADGRALTLGIGLVGTLWSVTAMYGALTVALGRVFGKGPRPFLRDKLAAFGFAALLAALALLSFIFSFVLQFVTDLLASTGVAAATRVVLGIASPTFGFLAGIVLFSLIYRALPSRRLPRGGVLLGAVLAAALWEVAKVAFALFTRNLGAFRSFGPLALAAGLLTWIYVSAIIVLVGAEVIKAVQLERAPR